MPEEIWLFLKLARLFTHCTGEWKSSPISKQTNFFRQLSRSHIVITLICFHFSSMIAKKIFLFLFPSHNVFIWLLLDLKMLFWVFLSSKRFPFGLDSMPWWTELQLYPGKGKEAFPPKTKAALSLRHFFVNKTFFREDNCQIPWWNSFPIYVVVTTTHFC